MAGASSFGQTQIDLDGMLAGLARSVQQLWTAPDLFLSIQELVFELGDNLNVDRIQFYKCSYLPTVIRPLIDLKFEWEREKGADTNEGQFLQDIQLFSENDRLFENLFNGVPAVITCEGFSKSTQSILFKSPNSRLLLLPILVEHSVLSDNSLWGVAIFEDFSGARIWSPAETSLLQVVASSIGGSISRMRADDAFQESEQRFRTILNSIPAGVLIVQAESSLVVALNQAAQQMIGARYETILGQNIHDLLPAPWDKPISWSGQSSFDSQESVLLTASGVKIPILRKPVYITIDRSNYIVEAFLSIVERKQAEQIQQEQRILAEALRDIANAINQSLNLKEVLETILISVDKVVPNESANIMLIEGENTRVFACRGYEKRGGNDHVMELSRRVSDVPNLIRMVETGLPIVVPDTDKSPDWIHFQASLWIKSYASAPICRNGKTIGFINLNSDTPGYYAASHADRLRSFADQAAIAIENARLYENARIEIEERKKAETALQQANNLLEERVEKRTLELRQANDQLTQELTRRIQAEQALEQERALLAQRVEERTAELSAANSQLARAARLKDTFIASMSHELRTPLNAILNIAETLQEQVYGELNPNQQKSMNRIEESGRHLLALINDILDLSKIGAGKLDLLWDSVQVSPLCTSSIQLIDEAARKKNISVTVDLDPALTTVWADQRRLKQILVNLLSNAVKFTPADGSVHLITSADPIKKQAHFTVTDTGIGIPPGRMENLFKPFVQLDGSLSRQYEGTGLGLALVYSLVELHGGGVSVESEANKGSKFSVTLRWDENEMNNQGINPASDVDFSSESADVVSKRQRGPLPGARLELFMREYGIQTTIMWVDNDFADQLAREKPEVLVINLGSLRSGMHIFQTLTSDPRTNKMAVIVVAGDEETIPSPDVLPDHFVWLPYSFTKQEFFASLRKVAPKGTGSLIRRLTILQERKIVSNPSGKRILIADDNELSARTLNDYLTSHGYRVTIAYNGAEAIERVREIPTDLVLMDIQMPGMDGIEAIRRIRADQAIQKIPIIVITALAMPGDRQRCIEAGANGYLSKPLSLKDLIEQIEAYVKGDGS